MKQEKIKPVQKILSALVKYKDEFGEYPTASELAKYIGVSRTWVYFIFKKLEDKGIVKYKSQTILNKQLASKTYGINLEIL